MIPIVENELKKRIRRAGITQKDISQRLKVPYSTVSSWLNGFAPLPENIRQKIEQMINDEK